MKIQELQTILNTLSAFRYAKLAVDRERENYSVITLNTETGQHTESKPSYYEYMKTMWHNEVKPPLQECIDRSFAAKAQEYGDLCHQYNDWVLAGKLFLLDTEKAVVYFMGKTERAKGEPAWVNYHVNYNPLNVDITGPVSHRHQDFVDKISEGIFDVSADEAALVAKCDLIAQDKEGI